MMRKYIAYIFLFSFIVSCADDDTVPKDIFPVNQMKLVMFDVLQAQELGPVMYLKDTAAARLKTAALMRQVFAIYKIKGEDFYKSFHYYEAHPDINKILFDSLSDYASRKKIALYQKMK